MILSEYLSVIYIFQKLIFALSLIMGVIISVRVLLTPISVSACQVTHSKMMARPVKVCTTEHSCWGLCLCKTEKLFVVNLNRMFNVMRVFIYVLLYAYL